MKRPAIFFDRDNTLIIADGYLGDPSKVKLIDGAASAVARGRSLGYAIVAFSNQSGVARGMFSEDDVRAVNARLDRLLRAQDSQAVIDRHEFCPDHPEATIEKYRRESDRRKPQPGMIEDAADELELDLTQSWVIGDAPRDIEAGKTAGCRTILFDDPNLRRSPAANEPEKAKPDHVCASLAEAIDIIESMNPQTKKPESPPAPPEVRPPIEQKSDPPNESRKLATITEQILYELRRRNEPIHDFSITKLLAGIAQVISVALVFLAYLYREDKYAFAGMLLFAIWLQTVTIALLIMGRQQ